MEDDTARGRGNQPETAGYTSPSTRSGATFGTQNEDPTLPTTRGLPFLAMHVARWRKPTDLFVSTVVTSAASRGKGYNVLFLLGCMVSRTSRTLLAETVLHIIARGL